MTNKLFTTDKIPQALIVRQAPLSNFDAFLKVILKGIVCSKHGCGECEWCKKIDNGSYIDLVVYDSKEMKKADVLAIMDRYSKVGFEKCNKKIYVIKNIEYASKSILNSLLKFVEEPPEGVYAIFTTRNYSAILPTIRSRCFAIYLEADMKDVDDFLNTKELNDQQKKLIKLCFYDLEVMKTNYDKFTEYLSMINSLVARDRLEHANEGLAMFRKMEYSEIGLFLEICKNSFANIAGEVIELQNNLYLNTSKALIYSQIYDLLGKVR